MKLWKWRIFIIPLTLFSACGLSPLANHRNAQDQGRDQGKTPSEVSDAASKTPCPVPFPKTGFCAELKFDSKPNDNDLAAFTLHFWNAESGSPSGPYMDPPYPVSVKHLMPSMTMRVHPIHFEHSKDQDGSPIPGAYRGTEMEFSMLGAWSIFIDLKKGPDTVEEGVISIEI